MGRHQCPQFVSEETGFEKLRNLFMSSRRSPPSLPYTTCTFSPLHHIVRAKYSSSAFLCELLTCHQCVLHFSLEKSLLLHQEKLCQFQSSSSCPLWSSLLCRPRGLRPVARRPATCPRARAELPLLSKHTSLCLAPRLIDWPCCWSCAKYSSIPFARMHVSNYVKRLESSSLHSELLK